MKENDFIKFRNYMVDINLEDLIKSQNKILKMANDIKKHNLSPFESVVMAYNQCTNFVYTMKNPYEVDRSRTAHQAIIQNQICCMGYSDLFVQILEHLDNKNIIPYFNICNVVDFKNRNKLELHMNNIAYVKDEKYNIEGIYTFDATNDAIRSHQEKPERFAFFMKHFKTIQENNQNQDILSLKPFEPIIKEIKTMGFNYVSFGSNGLSIMKPLKQLLLEHPIYSKYINAFCEKFNQTQEEFFEVQNSSFYVTETIKKLSTFVSQDTIYKAISNIQHIMYKHNTEPLQRFCGVMKSNRYTALQKKEILCNKKFVKIKNITYLQKNIRPKKNYNYQTKQIYPRSSAIKNVKKYGRRYPNIKSVVARTEDIRAYFFKEDEMQK